jgi:hypothetical protein
METSQACASALDFLKESKLYEQKEIYKIIINVTSFSFDMFFYPEYSRAISKSSSKLIECKVVSKFSCPPPPKQILTRRP